MAPERREVTRAWEALTPPLSEWIVDAVSSMGFGKMTPVQANCIPLFLGNKDVVVEVCVTGHNLLLSSSLISNFRQSRVRMSSTTEKDNTNLPVGSGKTLAFLIPVIEKLLRLGEPTKKHHIAAIIISPTR
jgi:ATP-dependent RNA helicase DDX55/SPB4